jgi:phosphoketolase
LWKAGKLPFVAGYPHLAHLEKQGVGVTVVAGGNDILAVAGSSPLMPELPAAAAVNQVSPVARVRARDSRFI